MAPVCPQATAACETRLPRCAASCGSAPINLAASRASGRAAQPLPGAAWRWPSSRSAESTWELEPELAFRRREADTARVACHRKAGTLDLSERQRRAWLRSLARTKDRRAGRVPERLLYARVPTSEELRAATAALAWRPRVDWEEEEEKEKKPKLHLENVRRDFLVAHASELHSAGLSAVSPAPLHKSVAERFLQKLVEHGPETLDLFYHGTPECNLVPIFDQGLRVPAGFHEVQNGAMHGLGIYLAEPGAHALSMGYLRGSTKMLVCGLVNTTKTEPLPVTKRHRYLVRGNLYAQSPHMRKVDSAMVVREPDYAVPLFVADLEGDQRDLHLAYKAPKNFVPALLACTRRCWDGDAGVAVWLPGVAEEDGHARGQKRRLTRRLRCIERGRLRVEKRGPAPLC